MSLASERALFAQSLSGDWQSRTELYRKFIYNNPRVRRLGARYSSIDDFLHDCFTNVLRGGHTFQKAHRLTERVELVAAWTALEQTREREITDSGEPGLIRLCAASEGDTPGDSAIGPYFPPQSGPQDSLAVRICGIVGEPQFIVIHTLATENATWDDAAEAAGKPVNSIGPIVARTIVRLSRYFGAPPPLNEDLETVFSHVSAGAAAARKSDPSKPRGRVIPMQLDPSFYLVTPEMRRVGLALPAEARTIVLWDAARASAPPGQHLRDHLDKCHYCADVLRSMLRMQQALLAGLKSEFLVCPGACTLLQDPDVAGEAVDRHLDECATCRDELTRTLAGEKAATSASAVSDGLMTGTKIAWAVVAAVILAVVIFAGYHYRASRNQAVVSAAQRVVDAPPIVISGKYAALAEKVSVDDDRVLASVLPRNQLVFMEARNDLKTGNLGEAMLISQHLVNEYNDPGAQMLYAVGLYFRSPSDGYRAMLKAEAMPPRQSFRCWSMLQCALLTGDTATIEREVQHLSSDPVYGVRAKNILARVHATK